MVHSNPSLTYILKGGFIRKCIVLGLFKLYTDKQDMIHSDQVVQLTTVDPHMLVRIVGITLDHGLLRTMPESNDYRSIQGGNFIDLQPDGNSFDIMGGLIKSKT